MILVLAVACTIADVRASSGSNRVISPTVVCLFITHENKGGGGTLDLLVLWRGKPGWFVRGGGTSGASTAHGGFGQWTMSQQMIYGDLRLTVDLRSDSMDFPAESTVATILGQGIALRETNVVLVDEVDTGRPTIVGTRHVASQFSGLDPVAAIIKRSPELYDFLQCDVVLPDTQMQTMMALVCGLMRP